MISLSGILFERVCFERRVSLMKFLSDSGVYRCPYYEISVTLSAHIAQNNDFAIRRVVSGELVCARSLSSCHLGTMIVFAACARFSEYIDEVRHSRCFCVVPI